MALFAVWRERQPSRSPDEVIKVLRQRVPFEPEDVTSFGFATPAGEWKCVAFSAATRYLSVEDQLAVGPGGFCVMHGLAWRAEGGEPRPDTAQDFIDSPAESRRHGTYSAITVDAEGSLRGVTDQHGLHHLYLVEDEDRLVLGNRAGFVAELADRLEPDEWTSHWLAAIGYRIGERTAFSGVRALPQGFVFEANDGSTRRVARDDRVLDVQGKSRGYADAGQEIDSLTDSGIEEAISAVRLAYGDVDSITLPISGGKDSRVVLALVLAAGFGDRLRLHTRGRPDHPDVVIGRQIADRYGVEFVSSPPGALRVLPVRSAVPFLDRVERFARLSEGMLGAWELVEPREGRRRVTMTGHLGEVLKGYAKRPFDPEDLDVIDLVKLQAPFDPMGLLSPEVVAGLRSELTQQLEGLAAATGLEQADLPDAFYYRNRVPNWLGGIVQAWAGQVEHIMPLGARSLALAAFRLTAAERKSEVLHVQILRRLEPGLLGVPLAGKSWDPALAKYLPGGVVPPPVLLPPRSQTSMFGVAGWQFSVNHNPAVRSLICDLIDEEADLPIWDAVDRERLSRFLHEQPLGLMELISVLGLLPSVFVQSERAKRRLSTQERASKQVEGLAGLHFTGALDRIEGDGVVAYRQSDPAPRSEAEFAATGLVTFFGWVFCPDFPGARVAVELIGEGGVVIARVPANRTRSPTRPIRRRWWQSQPSLDSSDVGDGKHGFELEIDAGELRAAANGSDRGCFRLRAVDSTFTLDHGELQAVWSTGTRP